MSEQVKKQVFKIALSPAQRISLIELSHKDSSKIPNGSEGRKYRRFCSAFGIKRLGTLLREQSGRANAKSVRDEKSLYLHEVTSENIEVAFKFLDGEKTPVQEDLLGDLYDLLEDLKKGGESYVAPAGIQDFDEDKDISRWLTDKEPECPNCGETVARNFKFCPECAFRLSPTSESSQADSATFDV